MIYLGADAMIRYLEYLNTRKDENSLLAIGLGDWCHVGGIEPKAPLIVTDSIMAMDIANKIAFMLSAVGMTEKAQFAKAQAEKYREAIRKNLIDFNTMTVKGNCQTSQAMCIFYDVFEESEKAKAFKVLLDTINSADEHIDLGVLGGRVIFHVLTQFGYSDLAFKMIVREDYPSYANILTRGATTLWENFHPTGVSSMNHHFWGDISAWFIKCIAGINPNPTRKNINEVLIKPNFISSLEYASAYHIAPLGKIEVLWKKRGEEIVLTVKMPSGVFGEIKLPEGYCFEDMTSSKVAEEKEYKIIKHNR
jgi:alpha-L-rhamnosidase